MAGAKSINPISSDLDLVIERSWPAFERLKGAGIFITGGTGFIGRWLVESLAWAEERQSLGVKAVVLSRDPGGFRRKAPHLFEKTWLTFVKGDVRNFSFPEGRFTDVIHCATAASAKINSESPLEMLDTIIGGTRRTLDFAVHSGAKRFLLASSGAVYGRQPPDLARIPEEYSGGPSTTDRGSAYAEGKRVAEYLCTVYGAGRGLEVKIARGFAFVGPFLPLDAHFAVGNFIRDSLAGGPIVVKGDGTPYRSYMYASDLASWLWTILTRGVTGFPYNVGSEEAVTVRALAQLVAKIYDVRIDVTVRNSPTPGAPAEKYVPSVRRASESLGLRVETGLEEALIKTIGFHRYTGSNR